VLDRDVSAVLYAYSGAVAVLAQAAAVPLLAMIACPDVGVPVMVTPLTLATVGAGSVPVRSPPAVAEIVAAVPSPRLVRAVDADAKSDRFDAFCAAPVMRESSP
jgi:PAB1-binding protein PBP1